MKLVRHRKILYGITYMWNQKKISEHNKKKKSHREQTSGYQWEEGKGRGSNGVGKKTGCYGII